MTEPEKEIWRRSEEKRARHEQEHFSAIKSALERQRPDFENVITPQELIRIAETHDYQESYIAEAITRIYQTSGIFALDNLMIGRKQDPIFNPILYFDWESHYQEIADTVLAGNIKLITETTKTLLVSTVKKAVAEGLKEGWSIQQMAEEIKNKSGITDDYRAIRIARTETVTASNMTNLYAAKMTGLDLQKVWLSALQQRTRRLPRDNFDHVAMNGARAEMDAPFKVPSARGVPEQIMHPGDPSASAGNRVNCRCTLIFTERR